jgi:hypothetical protein
MTTTYYALAGTFTTKDLSPDGDTIRFRPDHPRHVMALRGARPDDNGHASIPIRLEGVDAPELHYLDRKQRRAATARTRLLHRLGFAGWELVGDSVWRSPESRGWVIANEVDAHRRAIGFVYRASNLARAADGPIALDRATLLRSANADMLASGAAYHLAYASLDRAHRRTLHALAIGARRARRGVWSHDATRAFPFMGLGSVCERGSLVFPKLFRRCVDFCRDTAARISAAELVEWLRQTPDKDDRVEIDGRSTRMSALLTGGRELVRCTADPMRLVFDPKG